MKNTISSFAHLGLEITQGNDVSELRDTGLRL